MKRVIRKLLGDKLYKKIIISSKRIQNVIHYTFSKDSKMYIDEQWTVEKYGFEEKNTFFGYYDIQQLDSEEKKMLVHVVPKNAKTDQMKADIGYYDIQSKEYYKITESRAWCWQQGSRLRWYRNSSDRILVNNVKDDHYVTQLWDISSSDAVCVKEISMPLYDVDYEGKVGLSLNFSRLQRLRPGYGYSTLPDNSVGENASEYDGIFLVDLETDDTKLIVSLSDLAKTVDEKKQYEHYINHISMSPDGTRFIFFHIWMDSKKLRLYTCNIDGTSLRLLEDNDRASHYDWIDNEHILVTNYTKASCNYVIYNVLTGNKKFLNKDILNTDGHPSIYKDCNKFISDTYPLNNNKQMLFEYDMNNERKQVIANIYSSFANNEEKRCDLHPRLSNSEKIITIDSTVDGERKVLLLKKRK